VIPANGTLDSWTVATFDFGTFVASITAHLEIWRPAGGGTYTLIYMGPGQTVVQNGQPHTFPIAPPLAVTAGDLLGLGVTAASSISGGGCLLFTGDSGDSVAEIFGPVTVGNTYDGSGNTYPNNRLNIAANFIPTPGPLVYQCFNTMGGDDPNEQHTLESSFGTDTVTVRRAVMMCEIAGKDGEPAASGIPYFQCFTLTGGMDPNSGLTLGTENFGSDDVTVRASTMMCESASKNGSAPAPHVLQCFNVTGGNDPNENHTLDSIDQAEDEVRVRRSNIMCETAAKDGETTTEDPMRLQCFTITGGIDTRDSTYLVTDNFGYDDIMIRAATMMCEGATPNQAPIANNDTYSDFVLVATGGFCTFPVSAPGVLSNDLDPEGDSLTAVLSSGSVALNPDGSFTFQVGAVFEFSIGFTYRATDGQASSNEASVSLSGLCLPPIGP
jgi:hypothetical protein